MALFVPSLGQASPPQLNAPAPRARAQGTEAAPGAPLSIPALGSGAAAVAVALRARARRQRRCVPRRVSSAMPSVKERAKRRSGSGNASRDRCYLHKLGEEEAALLGEFRERVPQLAAEVRASGQVEAAAPLLVWGVDIEQSSDASDMVLLKYLRADDLNVNEAAARLSRTLRFRASEKLEELATAELPEHFRGHDIFCGEDPEGRPVVISRYGQMDNEKVFGNPDAFVRYRMQVIEKALKKLRFKPGAAEDLCQIHDYSGVSLLFKSTEVKNGIAAMSKVFSEHYPEIKGNTIFVNFPNAFAKIFQVFSVFIPERTRKKFQILGEGDQELLFKYLKPETVPQVLGGMRRDVADSLTGPCQMVSLKPRGEEDVALVQVDDASTIGWELRVCSKEAAFEVFFVPADGQDAGKELVVRRSERDKPLLAEHGILSGKFCAESPGVLRCRFRNERAWLQERLCLCRAERLP